MPIPASLHNGFLIHAPRQGSDPRRRSRHPRPADFNPRPLRGDFRNLNNNGNTNKFQPTLPMGERLFNIKVNIASSEFQSTLPVGGATLAVHDPDRVFLISIHAPRGGSDVYDSGGAVPIGDFNPRSPWGERPKRCRTLPHTQNFNPRSPWGERLAIMSPPLHDFPISIHAPRGGSDRDLIKG